VFPFSYMVSNADRNTFYSFFKNKRGGWSRFWAFWPVTLNCYDEYVGVGGPWDLLGVMRLNVATYTDYTVAAANATAGDVSIHPTTGVAEVLSMVLPRPCTTLTFTISQAGTGTYTIASVKYSKSDGTYAALTVTDNTTNFKAAAGDSTITISGANLPTDWDTATVNGATGYVIQITFSTGTVTQAPLVTRITCNSVTFDLPSLGTTNDATCVVYLDGAMAIKTFVSGGGGGGSDRVTFGSFPGQGVLITADFIGKLRIKGFFSNDAWKQGFPTGNLHAFQLSITEDRST
jgi:hypothetical protein